MLGGKKCSGRLVRHYWVCKQCVKKAVEQSIVDLVVAAGMEGMKAEWDEVLVDGVLEN